MLASETTPFTSRSPDAPGGALLDSLLQQWMLAELQGIGLFKDAMPVALTAARAVVEPLYHRWLEETLAILERSGHLVRDGQTWRTARPGLVDMGVVRTQWRDNRPRWMAEEGIEAYLALMEATLAALGKILTGQVPATDVMFPGGSMHLVAGIYKNNRVSDHFNGVLRDRLVAYVKLRLAARPADRLRIIEIGAGTGATTAVIVKALGPFAANISEYCYTDLSKAFLATGQRLLGATPFVTYKLLDIESNPAEQGHGIASYDLVVATNVLHATRSITNTLRNAKALLKQNGLLFINEMIGGVIYLHLTFGLLEGWWRYDDAPLRIPGCPGLLPQTWQRLLEETGFRAVSFPAEAQHHLGQQVIIAESDGVLTRDGRALPPRPKGTASLSAGGPVATPPPPAPAGAGKPSRGLRDRALEYLRAHASAVLGVPRERIDPAESLASYGLDSILATQLAARLSPDLDSVYSTTFYEHPSLAALADHLLKTDSVRLLSLLGGDQPVPSASPPPPSDPARVVVSPPAPSRTRGSAPPVPPRRHLAATPAPAPDRIAIIGLSGRYAGAPDVQRLWRNLLEGKCSITEIPRDRWDGQAHFHENPSEAARLGKSYGRWGGFVDGIGSFDPAAFNLAPRDAELIDPQELMLLEQCWNALEDAGHAPSRLSDRTRAHAGVFAALTKHYAFPPTSFASAANRVSYCLNFQGKSLPIDTMCSSALVAIHEACEYLRRGGGELAVVGAVNLYLEPSAYVHLSASQFLARTAQSLAFAKGGAGFVPGEGAGAVVLKPLAAAEADGDSIYGVIIGSAVNHGGRSASFTAANPAQQASVIRAALDSAGVDPRSISYIEAAANGIELGDAIEMNALTKVFADRRGARGHFAVGSIKPSIGHCEAASGMSQLTKVLLALKHQTLPPTVLAGPRNPQIDFDALPFTVQDQLAPWRPIAIDGAAVPRRAGIMSVGGGGVNAHVLVEEAPPPAGDDSAFRGQPLLFVLSARDRQRLAAHATTFARWLDENDVFALASLVFTLQEGREALSSRLAIVTTDRADLKAQLTDWLATGRNTGTCASGDVKDHQIIVPAAVEEALVSGRLRDLASLWVLGNDVPWRRLYRESPPRRMGGLPEAPYDRRTVWTPSGVTRPPAPVSAIATEGRPAATPTPGVAEATSRAEEFYDLSTLTATEDFSQEYLTLCPFPERIPGFSMTRAFIEPDKCPNELQLMRTRQIEMRQVLFCKEDFARIERVFDIGCGHGTDVIQLAATFPGLRTEGYTISAAQARLGNQRIAQLGQTSRSTIYHRDSARVPFPGRYDLVIGIEVLCHISDKDGVLGNIAQALAEGGRVLLLDFIANLRGRITAPDIAIDISTEADWVDCLSKHGLMIDEVIDVSPQIANFLYDPDHEANVAALPKVARDSFRNFANNYLSLERGWLSYCMIKLGKPSASTKRMSAHELRAHNAARIARKTSYPDALAAMRATAPPVYPPATATPVATRPASAVSGRAAPPPKISPLPAPSTASEILSQLTEVFCATLGFTPAQLTPLSAFSDLGIGSINAVELAEAINRRFGLQLASGTVVEQRTLAALAAVVASTRAQDTPPGRNGVAARTPQESTPQVRAAEIVARATALDVEATVDRIFRDVLGVTSQQLEGGPAFDELGITSINAVELTEAINQRLGLHLATGLLLEQGSLPRLISLLRTEIPRTVAPPPPDLAPEPRPDPTGYAVVGISCRFPKADGLAQYWDNIEAGRVCVDEVPERRWDWRAHFGDPRQDATRTTIKWGAFIEGEDEFDPLFFGVTPREAELIDPETRLLLSFAWRALEDAGLAPDVAEGAATGVFVATGPGDYQEVLREHRASPWQVKNVPSMIPNRISHTFDLKGPSEYCETACSSTLVAIHRAIQAIERGECKQALVAAVNLTLSPAPYPGLELLGVLAPDGRSHSFEDSARGYVRGEGVGAIVVKPLAAAQAQGDRIYAVIKGTGVAHGGRGVSLAAPSQEGMATAIAHAYRAAGIDPGTVGYIEAQGVAAALADETEIAALKAAFRSDRGAPCVIGTLKPSIGHCEYASGMAALLKAILAVRHGVRPGIPGFGQPRAELALTQSRFVMSAKNADWPVGSSAGQRRRAAVNSFGIGGVNAHLVLEEPPPASALARHDGPPVTIVLSARTDERLRLLVANTLSHLERSGEASLAAIAYTLQVGRVAMKARVAFRAQTLADLKVGLRAFLAPGSAAFDHSVELFGTSAPARPGILLDEAAVATALRGRDAVTLARHWAAGGAVPWAGLWSAPAPTKVSLPGHPLTATRCWPRRGAETPKTPTTGAAEAPDSGRDEAPDEAERTAERLVPVVAATLGLSRADVDIRKPLSEWGIDSLGGATLLEGLRKHLGREVPHRLLTGALSLVDIVRALESGGGPAPALMPPPTAVAPLVLRSPDSGMSRRTLRLPGGKTVEIFRGGAGRPLLLVPGLGMTGDVFAHQFADLRQRHDLIVYHYPGLGGSEGLASNDLPAAAEHLCETTRALGLEAPALLGWSFGGMLAQLAVLSRPSAWGTLILVSTLPATKSALATPASAGDAPPLLKLYEDDLGRVIGADAPPTLRERRDDILALLDRSRGLTPGEAIGYLGGIRQFDVSRKLYQVASPTLVVAGSLDRFSNVAENQRLAELIPNAELAIIPGAGHTPFITHPDQFNQAVLGFLARTSSYAPAPSEPPDGDDDAIPVNPKTNASANLGARGGDAPNGPSPRALPSSL
jgi:polyketide synthase PksM